MQLAVPAVDPSRLLQIEHPGDQPAVGAEEQGMQRSLGPRADGRRVLRERQLEEALMLENPITDITIAMEVNYFQLNRAEYFVPVAVKIPGSELALAKRRGAFRTLIDFIGEVKDDNGYTIQNMRDKLDIPLDKDTAEKLEEMLAYLDRTFDDDEIGPRDAGVPRLLIGGHADASFERAARYGATGHHGVGWVAGGASPDQYAEMAAKVRSAWADAGNDGEPRLASLAYFALGAVGGLGGYTSTAEGKLIAASFLDNYNKIVLTIRDQGSLIRTGSAAGDANAAGSTQAGAPVSAGQMYVAKIANVKVYASASRDSKVVATLNRSDELVASGEVKDGFVQVDAANFSGWVQRTLVMPGSSYRH